MTPMSSDRASGKPSGLQGVDRALAILELLADAPMRAKDIADALDLKWSTAHRTLVHLRETGCLVRDEATGLYHIGPRIYFIGSSYIATLPLVTAARAYLRAAVRQTGTVAQVAGVYDRYSMNLLIVESEEILVERSSINFHFPLHCGSKGQVLLAFASDEFVDSYLKGPLEPLTRRTVTDPDELRSRLGSIRERDYALTKGDVQLSTGSVAAPIRDAAGNVIASVTLIANYGEFDEKVTALIDAVMNTARSISLQLGWRPGLFASRS